MTVDWVVFDFGDVICGPNGLYPKIAERLGVEVTEFERHYWEQRPAFDLGTADETRYWTAVAAGLGLTIDEREAIALNELDMEGWLTAERADTVQLIHELGEAGVRLALLSNAPSAHGRNVVASPWGQRFAHTVFSADVKVMKPSVEIYRLIEQKTGATPERHFFLDDRQPNVDAARAAGWRSELFTDAATARTQLVELGVL
ncbi:HAD family phosphatase [Pseudonocardiaceae bacterium YIM PH 21723]|nr:HAD family phosphatase [Pseudonocardiaceae bacterium YIM PH 21723]